MLVEDLHDAVLACQLELLNPLLLEILLRSQEVLMLQRRKLLFQVQMFLVITAQLRIPIDQRTDQLFFVFFHAAGLRGGYAVV